MLEQGENSKILHENLGKSLAESNVDILITMGNYSEFTSKVFKKISKTAINYHFEKISEVYAKLIDIIKNDDVILFKGSRSFHMENLVNRFL